ncbi:hypothetical protein [Variovorax sp. GrIS 2.14]|uniref:hypothetical protein n=1 Tax=Variovorax sp. GrIS 2.14 TaxID=3071709 RepID=UPI0038F62F5E
MPASIPVNTSVQRRANTLALFHLFTGKYVAGGGPAKGIEAAFAASIEISASRWSQIKNGIRQIGDVLARQIETHSNVPAGWLDMEHEAVLPNDARVKFLDLAARAWDASNAEGKRALRSVVQERLKTAGSS